MASTHAPSEALSYAKTFIKKAKLDDTTIAYQILDEVSKTIWYAAPWSWTIAQMGSPTLSADVQDYTTSIPTDYEYLFRATLIDTGYVSKNLKIVPILPQEATKYGEPVAINFSGSTLRVFPRPPVNIPTNPIIQLFYKKTAPEITVSNYATTGSHILPDRWWHVYKAGVLAKAFVYADDDRALSVQLDPRTKEVKLGGYEAYFQHLINEMRLKEPMPYEWETYQESTGDNR